MSIGILGAGNIGKAFAKTLARNGIEATIANSRGPESLAAFVRELPGIRAGTREEAAKQAIVLVAVPWAQLPQALAGLDLKGKVVIDANNALDGTTFQPIDLDGRTSTAAFAELVPGARVVKAFNHLFAAILERDPKADGGQRVLFLSGDDAEAKTQVSKLIERLQFFPIDLGTLQQAAHLTQFPGGPLPAHNLVRLG
ncbi:MAG: NADPH-dependent F420 reductase [Polyangiales bacterium]